MKIKSPQEWFNQGKYDLDTAEALFKTGRYIYTVFMCHLSIEKALKGLYARKFKKNPPKIHNLNYFSEKIDLPLPEDLLNFLDKLNSLSILTRYPDELKRLVKDYKKDVTEKVLEQTRELFACLQRLA